MRPIATIKLGPSIPTRYVFGMRPVPKQRTISMVSKRGKKFCFTPSKTEQYEALVKAASAIQHSADRPYEADLNVMINFFISDRKHGDIDNLAKAILDGMQGVVFKNDKQIKSLHLLIILSKSEGTEVLISPFAGNDELFELPDECWLCGAEGEHKCVTDHIE